MKEKDFYDIVGKMADAILPSGMGNYYPTVEELKISMEGHSIEEFLPVLSYYASDPFNEIIDAVSYKDTVKYAKELTSQISLT